MVGKLVAAGVLAAMAACQDTRPAVPLGAVKVEPGLWMVPTAPEPGGCRRFTKWAKDRAVDRAIYFRTPQGGFSMSRARSECAAMEGPRGGKPQVKNL